MSPPAPAGTRGGASGRTRGQTAIDYLIGISVFLVAILFVFGFVPSIFAPFGVDTGSDTVLADRSADRLAADLLAESAGEPAVLNRTCTTGFFDGDGSVPAGCRYDHDADALGDALGLNSFTNANVTLRQSDAVQSLDGTTLAAGEQPDASADVVVARRVVLLAGEQYQLYVRVW